MTQIDIQQLIQNKTKREYTGWIAPILNLEFDRKTTKQRKEIN